MVLAVMVIFLCFRVYQIIQPDEPDSGATFSPPRGELSDSVDTPGRPPQIPVSDPPQSWRGLWTRPPFIYVRPGDSGGSSEAGDDQVDLELLNLQPASDGSYRVRIRSASRRGWYSEGDAFEAYEILSIDPDTNCVEIYAEELGKRVEICLSE